MNRMMLAATLLGFGFAAAPAAVASSFQIDPVRLEIGPDRRSATLRVRNSEAVPVMVRIHAFDWTQADGEDRRSPSGAVIVSPPIVTIPAGGTQLIRVGLRAPSAEPRAFRLVVEEVPQPSESGGVRVALRLDLPLFAMIAAGSPSELSWSAAMGGDGRWFVEAANRGRHYVRVDRAAAEAATGVGFGDGGDLGTVLPGSRRRWPIGPEPRLVDRERFASITRTSRGADTQLANRGD